MSETPGLPPETTLVDEGGGLWRGTVTRADGRQETGVFVARAGETPDRLERRLQRVPSDLGRFFGDQAQEMADATVETPRRAPGVPPHGGLVLPPLQVHAVSLRRSRRLALGPDAPARFERIQERQKRQEEAEGPRPGRPPRPDRPGRLREPSELRRPREDRRPGRRAGRS